MTKKLNNLLPLLLLVIFTLIPRLYRLDRPLGDWHSWRQADTAAVTRRYVKEGIDLLHPKYDDLSSIPSGLDNPTGYRMVEFPLINGVIAAVYQSSNLWQNIPIHVFSRYFALAFSLASVIFLYGLINLLDNRNLAFICASIYALLPFNIFFHSTALPEVHLLFFAIASMYFWVKFSLSSSQSSKLSYFSLLAFLFTASIAFLIKPTFIFFIPPLLYILIKNFGLSPKRLWLPLLTLAFTFIPLLLWRSWIAQFPEGIPANTWLLNGNGIRFKGAFFRWLFAERIGKWILGYWGLILVGLGTILKPNQKSGWFYHWWLISMLAYLSIFATGNVTHDYYQIIIVPIIAIFMGIGAHFLMTSPSKYFNKFIVYCLLFIVFSFTFAFSWFHIRDYFNINNPAIVAAGEAVDQLLPSDAKVIAPYMGDTAFLYQTNRLGWPIGGEISKKITQGATAYVSTSYDDEARQLEAKCDLIKKTDQYIIIDLRNCDFK